MATNPKTDCEAPYLIRYKGPEALIERRHGTEETTEDVEGWSKSLPPHERLFKHSTMSSARRNVKYHAADVPQDRLDFVMEAVYDPINNTFPDKGDPYLHVETVFSEDDARYKSWRVLRNRTMIVPEKKPARGHPIVYGGVPERESVFHVKLGIMSYHSPQTNPGYSRTPSGSFYAI